MYRVRNVALLALTLLLLAFITLAAPNGAAEAQSAHSSVRERVSRLL